MAAERHREAVRLAEERRDTARQAVAEQERALLFYRKQTPEQPHPNLR